MTVRSDYGFIHDLALVGSRQAVFLGKLVELLMGEAYKYLLNDNNYKTGRIPVKAMKAVCELLFSLSCVMRASCRPYGARSDFPLHPGLTPWANTFRPFRGWCFYAHGITAFLLGQVSR